MDLFIFTVQASDNGKLYRVVFTNSYGTATSNAAALTVGLFTAPLITLQPVSQTVTPGVLVTFTAMASGNPPPTVQWQVSTDKGKTWSLISDATSTT